MARRETAGTVPDARPDFSRTGNETINAAIGRLIASVPESHTMGFYNTMTAMGANMDPELLKGAMPRQKTTGTASDAKPDLSQAGNEAINATLGRLIASVPESRTMDFYNTIANLCQRRFQSARCQQSLKPTQRGNEIGRCDRN